MVRARLLSTFRAEDGIIETVARTGLAAIDAATVWVQEA
jgi:hypothetical protein